jgi:hypothetical protein
VALSSTLGSVPASVPVPADATVVTFDFASGAVIASGTVTATLNGAVNANVDVVDPSNFEADLSGFVLTQTNTVNNAVKTFTIPANTHVPVNGYLVLGRDGAQGTFESFWGPLPAGTVYKDTGGAFISINDEPKSYVLKKNDGTVIDGPTIPTVQGKSMQRVVPVLDADQEDAWVQGEDEPGSATPGGGQALGGDRGCYVSEMSDASGSGNFIYEMVEIFCDGPVP